MKFRRRPRLTSREIGLIMVIVLVTMIVLSTLIGADIRVSSLMAGGGAFFAPWAGVRGFVWNTANPYTTTAATQVQELAYGRPATTRENPYLLTIPFFLLPFYLPLALISDPTTARGIWLLLCEAAILGIAFLSLGATGWKPSRLFLAAHSVAAIFGFYPIVALVAGTPAVMAGLIYATMLWAYAGERDELAGALAVLALFSWETGIVFLVFFAGRMFHDKRWGVLGGFGMTLIVLLIISFLIFPGWLLPFFTVVLGNVRSPFGFSTGAILQRLSPLYGARIAQVMTLVFTVLLTYEWAAGRRSDLRRFVWTTSLALAVTPLLGFRSELANLVVLFPALSLIGAAGMARGRRHAWLALFVLAAAFFVPWLLVAAMISTQVPLAPDYLYLFYPLLCIVGLYWTRWWFIRPGGTWLDEVRGERSLGTRTYVSHS